MSPERKYRLVLVEPSAVIAAGMQAILSGSGRFTLAEHFADTNPLAQWRLDRLEPDAILLNPSLIPPASIANLRHNIPCLAPYPLAAIVSTLYADSVLQPFDAVLSIADSKATLLHKLEGMMTAAETDSGTPDSDHGGELSVREKDILVAVATGKTNKEIAEAFHLSVYTIITHRKNISRKLGIRTVSGLTVYAIMNKLINPADL